VNYLVDSDWIIDGLKGIPSATGTLARLGPGGLAISTIAFAEVLEGAMREPDPAARIADLRAFLTGYRMLPVTEETARIFAKRRAALRQQGNLIPDLDLLIAATAIEHGLALLTRNRGHFARVPGLTFHTGTATP
jgi:tRNA(fMet)-specific endonuclease VapC